MKNHTVIKDPVYGGVIHVLTDATPDRLRVLFRTVASDTTEKASMSGTGCAWEFGVNDDGAEPLTYVIGIRSETLRDAYSISVLVHEALHVTQNLMENIGMGKLTAATDEAYCYYQDFIVREALKKFL